MMRVRTMSMELKASTNKIKAPWFWPLCKGEKEKFK